MSAFSTKGMTVWLEQKPGSGAAPVTVTQITNSKPAVATVAIADIGKFKEGDVVTVAGTDSSLDGGVYTVGTVDDTANTVSLAGSDASSESAVMTTGTLTNHQGDFVEFCVSSLEHAQEPATTISVATTCDPSAQIAGDAQAGTLNASGFIDLASEGYLEFLRASKDGIPRMVLQVLPPEATDDGSIAEIIYPSVTASGSTKTYAVNQAAAWSTEMTLGADPVLRMGA